MNTFHQHRIVRLSLLLASLFWGTAIAVPYHVVIDTGTLPAAGFVLAFDFIDGGAPGNSVLVSGLSADGSLGAVTLTGDVTGSFPGGISLGDASFFTEVLLPISSSTKVSFDLRTTANGPVAPSVPDTFSFYLLDRQSLLPLFASTDASGADALFTLGIDGSQQGNLSVFKAVDLNAAATWAVEPFSPPVPEPGTYALMLAGLVGCATLLRRRYAGPARDGFRLCPTIAASFAVWVALAAPATADAAFHVTPSGGQTPHDGLQWQTAFDKSELQAAINQNPGAEFWLARGAYGDIQTLPDGTQLYGGFEGFLETDRSQRDPRAHATILQTVTIVPYLDSNGIEVIPGPTTVVDGFLIFGGLGIILEKSSPILSHLVIRGAQSGIDAKFGAGPLISDSEVEGGQVGLRVDGPKRAVKGPDGKMVEIRPTVIRSSLRANGDSQTAAAGIFQNFNDPPTLLVSDSHISDMPFGEPVFLMGDAQFKDSFVENNGLVGLAAVVVQGFRPGQIVSFDNCAIRNNKGTGINAHPMANSSIFIRNSEVSGNVSQTIGGGIVVANDGVQIINSKITGNQSALDGGGVVYTSFSVPISRTLIVNSLIAGNRAGRNGGGVAVNQTAVSVLNSTIAGNSAAFGGGVWLDWYGGVSRPIPQVTFVNTAITGNTAPSASAIASQVFGVAAPQFRNVATLATDTYASSYNFVTQAAPSGNGNFTVADPGYLNGATGDYRLTPSSFLVERGDTSAIDAYILQGGVAKDLAGQPRIAGPAVDVGAYEAQKVAVTDVTSQVTLQRGGFVFNRATQRYVQQITLTISSGGAIAGPVSLVLDGLANAVTLSGQTGVTATQLPAGSAYVDLTAADMAPGVLVTRQLQFADPSNQAIGYTPRVLAGPGNR